MERRQASLCPCFVVEVFLQPRDLKLILDDPQAVTRTRKKISQMLCPSLMRFEASLPQKEVRSIRSQGLGLGSHALPGPASQPEVSGLQAARQRMVGLGAFFFRSLPCWRHAAADLEAPRGQAENSDTGLTA